MTVETTELPGVLLVTLRKHADDRGLFYEAWHQERYAEAGIPGPFVQDNVSQSRRGVVRGLHFQHPHPQGKLVSAVRGAVWDVVVDVRRGSPTFGRWAAFEISDANGHQLWVPPGFAHGFQVLSDEALFMYKCTERYRPEGDRSLRWNDPALGITWPLGDAILSPKDRDAPLLAGMGDDALPAWQP
jgi:dTDP-4-dehydrorhamnose 3,5-epimerase